jgi:3-deoxy-D-manno-octulosonic-acid transferase
MYLLYSLLLIVWGFLLLPFFLYRAWRYNKTLPGMDQRLGHLPAHLQSDGRTTLWFHSCSVGETLSLPPLVHILRQRFPKARFLFSTITKTGQEVAIKQFGKEHTFYFPIDFAFIIKRILRQIRPAMIVIIDTEIWPNLLHQARRHNIPVVLANGRISAQSFRYYRWARPVLRGVFPNYATLLMQSEEDAVRIRAMGAPSEKIVVAGNIKFDRDLIARESVEALRRDLENSFDLGRKDSPLIVAGSTHRGEEQVLLDVLEQIRRIPTLEKTRLLLAPRHPERFDEVAELALRSGFAVRRRSQVACPEEETPVLLLDTLGELAEVYRFATLVFVGGTLIRRGGHSILEPAAFSKAIAIGPSMENFQAVGDTFRSHGGVRQITADENNPALQTRQLLEVFQQLLQNSKERDDLGAAAFSILEQNRGAAQRTGETISGILEKAPGRGGR